MQDVEPCNLRNLRLGAVYSDWQWNGRDGLGGRVEEGRTAVRYWFAMQLATVAIQATVNCTATANCN